MSDNTKEDLVKGLREMADWLEANESIPVASWGTVFGVDLNVYGEDRDQALGTVRSSSGPWEKRYIGSSFELIRKFSGGCKYSFNISRAAVCDRRVVGTELVEVPDPNAPKITEEREVVEWDCHPLLTAD